MALSFALIIIFGLLANKLFERLKLPGLLGMLLVGIIIGPYVLNILNKDILLISGDLRKIALIVILLRAGLGIKKETLNKIGIPAIKMSFIPGLLEGFILILITIKAFNLSFNEAGILAFIIAAVSPAVVVPSMLTLIERGKGENKGIPTLILASASIDDVFAITIYSTFLSMYTTNNISIFRQLINIPISIILGIILGLIIGLIITNIFKTHHIRDTKKTLILLGTAIIFTSLEDPVKNFVPIATLLGVMTMGFILLEKYPVVANRLSTKLNKVWILAEIVLFVLVGAEVNIFVAMDSGLLGILVIAIGLIGRSIGVFLSLIGTDLNYKERLFCIIAYTPKATVQAAIGAVPLSMGVENGELILAMAVLAIIITAPLGAIGIKFAGEKYLT
ncbi:cation:proton antiporter [Clostridium sp. D2Q-11]|uniref:Cation:proton antiporter n=2 Tax=Bacteria TaxID=2 RepID=A0A942Z920_9FIRM|nr:cation:proton antiporter [Anaeromonas frigoriresistens]AER38254.1 NhaR [bacterium Y.Mu1]MBS4538868.1 cation:proton antiporter [Anaeromonas frigoriresistens]